MRILVDCNILISLIHSGRQSHAEVLQAMGLLHGQSHELCVVPQVLYEYWVVATRPIAVNGLGFAPTKTMSDLRRIQSLLTLLRNENGIYDHWERLVATHNVLGKAAHDARLAAAMEFHGITHFLTQNPADFRRYAFVSILTPEAINSGRASI